MANGLTVKEIEALKDPRLHADGQVTGLYLSIAKSRSKSFIERIAAEGRRRDIGLGGFPSTSLSTAREWARDNRSRVASGKAPLSARQRRKLERAVPVSKQCTPTVRDIAGAAYEQAVKDGRWTHEKNVRAWTTRYLKHVDAAIGDIPIDRVDKRELRDLREMKGRQTWPLPPTLDELVPLDHPDRFIPIDSTMVSRLTIDS